MNDEDRAVEEFDEAFAEFQEALRDVLQKTKNIQEVIAIVDTLSPKARDVIYKKYAGVPILALPISELIADIETLSSNKVLKRSTKKDIK